MSTTFQFYYFADSTLSHDLPSLPETDMKIDSSRNVTDLNSKLVLVSGTHSPISTSLLSCLEQDNKCS